MKKDKTKETGGVLIMEKLSKKVGITWAKRIVCALLSFMLAILFGGTAVFPGTYPLGLSLVAASSGLTATISAMAGALIGAIRIPTVGGTWALMAVTLTVARLLLSAWLASDKLPAVLVNKAKRKKFTSRLFGELRRRPSQAAGALLRLADTSGGIMLRENIRVRMALSSLAALFAGAWSVVEGGWVYYDLLSAVFSLAATPMITYLLYAVGVGRMRQTRWRDVSVYAFCAFLTLSLDRWGEWLFHELFAGLAGGVGAQSSALSHFSLGVGVLFAFAVSCLFAVQFGSHRGAIVGFVCGLVMEPLYIPLYALGGVTAGLIASSSATLGFLAAGTVGVAYAVYTAGLSGFLDVFPPVALALAGMIPLYRAGILRLPDRVFPGELAAREMRAAEAVMAEISYDETKRKIGELGEGLGAVSTILYGMSEKLCGPTRAEMRELCVATFERHCASCASSERCKTGRRELLLSVVGRMADSLATRGTVGADVIPSPLASSCGKIGRILDDVNYEAARRITEQKREDKLEVTAADFGLLSDTLRQAGRAAAERGQLDDELSKKLGKLLSYHDFRSETAVVYGGRQKQIFVTGVDLSSTRMGGEDIRKLFEEMCGCRLSVPEFELDGAVLSMRMHSIDSFTCTSGTFSCAASSVHKYYGGIRSCGANCAGGSDDGGGTRTIEITDTQPPETCGDAICTFSHDGKYYMILSDGMGSGREAALTAGICVSLLERLIRAGVVLETALKMLNQIVRHGSRECSATVDIAEIDLVSGDARFIKSGAAPTFILRDGSIFRLQSKTVPIGIIRALDAEMLCFEIRSGDTVVMISDGAARSYEEAPWLLDLMTVDETVLSGDERLAAEKIVAEAALRAGKNPDDITAGIVRVRCA